MPIRRSHTSLAVLALAAAIALASAHVALALFSKLVVGGSMTIATSTLALPTGLTAVQVSCKLKKTPEIEVDWTATSSSYVTSYSVERATSSNGTYVAIASTTAPQTVYTDKSSLAYSTTYYYRVGAVYRSWSTVSAVKSVKTLSSSCV